MSVSTEQKVPTQQLLLPGQQFCVGLPWERAGLPKHGLPPAPAPAAPAVNPLDKLELEADPVAGLELGACQVIRRLSSNSASALLAVRADAREGTALVALRRLEVPEAGLPELLEHAHWASHFRHVSLARVYGCEASDEGLFWVTEFSSGANLHEISAQCRKIGKAVPIGLSLSVVYEAASALAELHVPGAHAHGMVSDETVFLTFDGRAKLMDLGLMRCIAGKVLRPEGLAPMAPYLSPEQVSQGRLPDPKTDVYALAAVLHECLSGQKLPNGFERQPHFVPPSSFNVALGPPLDAVVLKGVDADRSRRYAHAADFAKALKAAASAFMWKPQQRADFVSQLFQTRKRREQVLLAGCEELAWRPTRIPTAPKLPEVETPAAPKPTRSMRAAPSPHARPAGQRARGKPTPNRGPRARVRALCLGLTAAALALVWERALVDSLVHPRPAPMLGARAAAALGPAPRPLPPDVGRAAEVSEELAERTLATARALYATRPKAKAAARKKGDPPLPPWLQPRGRRR